jgi:ATP-dependent Clp protease ATP-binding subunit ClpA
MIEPSQSLQNIFEFSVGVAKKLTHEYITIEHLAFGMMSDEPTFKLIEQYGADANFI